MELLCDEITYALQVSEEGSAPAEALVLSYGITGKRARGFLLLLIKGGIPKRFTDKLYDDATITDFVVVGSVGEPGAPGIVAYPPPQDENPPTRPDGYSLLTKPASLIRPEDERWIAQAVSDNPDEGMGILIYEEARCVLFLTAEEAISTAACVLRVAPALLAASSDAYLRLHPSEAEALSTIVWEAEQKRMLALMQQAATELPAPVSHEALNAWLARHGYRLIAHDDLPGFRIAPKEKEGGEVQE